MAVEVSWVEEGEPGLVVGRLGGGGRVGGQSRRAGGGGGGQRNNSGRISQ